ncbi:MAG: DegQ family serine endoprotease [Acidobacteria bacterium]|nr:MAG: DegQ family serine endoprotease [Acidobacteriota bacterium]REK01720.1 MAG: DegQ family serine endoprotease [Acidobacteriota bacterium]REK14676.1 MAG: DegQ family serine endoprotease [Acidobacteriota bacterium]REK45391.1 MAG: DegQ family serine endoprotease [Acidobacteriota bacterium]
MFKALPIFQKQTALILVLILCGLLTGCGTGWLSFSSDAPKPAEGPETPPEPVVVDGVRTSYADVVSKTTPAVVQITAINRGGEAESSASTPFEDLFPDPEGRRSPQQRPSRGLGSGVIVKDDGTILTNHHVIDGADKITVEMNDGQSFNAEVVGSDRLSDLAVLKIEGEGLPFITLGDSDKVRIGDIVLAIGNPLGIGQTVTSGIISAKSRRTQDGDNTSFQDFLQTDAPINQGNSGGALVNVKGELIGINSQILSRSGGNIGIGFAIPSNMAKSVMDQLIENGEVRRGMLGINIQNISSDLAEALGLDSTRGVVVSNVLTGSAAESAGLKRGDIIKKIAGEEVEDDNFLRNKVAGTLPGTTVKLTILRDGKEQQVDVRLGEFKTETAGSEERGAQEPRTEEPNDGGKLGISLSPLTPEAAERLNIPTEVRGLVITEVDQGGPAAEKGLRRGDVIVEINRELVGTLSEARTAIAKSGDRAVLLLVSRRGQTFFVSVRPN